MLIEASRPLCIRLATGDLHLKPGVPVEFPDDDAVQLLAKKPDAVRRVSAPAGYCALCGRGYWIRIAHTAAWQCGRCHPSESPVETLFVPGGSVRAENGTQSGTDGTTVVEPAMKPDGTPLSPVYWESQGRIVGPGQPGYIFRDRTGQEGMGIRYEGGLVEVADAMLRSHKAFLEHRPLKEVEPVREDHR